jgi:hypothetical protein
MAASQTIYVSHLGGIEAGYKLSGDRYDASKPTCVLINSMCMTVSLYRPQFECKELTDTLNLAFGPWCNKLRLRALYILGHCYYGIAGPRCTKDQPLFCLGNQPRRVDSGPHGSVGAREGKSM